MRRLLVSMVLFGALVGAAAASGYDDFASGMFALVHQDNDVAIKAFSAALASPDLSAGLIPQAHLQRGRAYLGKDRCADALADLDAALAAKPGDRNILTWHMSAARCAGKPETALADAESLIAGDSEPGDYFTRGEILLELGQFDAAARDLAAYEARTKSNPYAVLLLEIARTHAGTFDAKVAAKDIDAVHTLVWPGPALALFAGKRGPESIAAAAEDGDADGKRGRLCEADFYVAEWWLMKKDAATAKPLLEHAHTTCPHAYIEWSMADVELNRLGP